MIRALSGVVIELLAVLGLLAVLLFVASKQESDSAKKAAPPGGQKIAPVEDEFLRRIRELSPPADPFV